MASTAALFTLLDVPLELLALITARMSNPTDCVSSSLAHRDLAEAIRTGNPVYKTLLYWIAMQLQTDVKFLIDETVLRRYARSRAATIEGCEWLNAQQRGPLRLHVETESSLVICNLKFANSEAHVRVEMSDGTIVHYEGASDEERVVCCVHSDGDVTHYEGASDEERVVCCVHSDGDVTHYDRAGNIVRLESSDG